MGKEISKEALIAAIKKNLENNNGKWNLCDDQGHYIFRDEQTGYYIPDLALDGNGDPCALLSLNFFSEELLLKIYKSM